MNEGGSKAVVARIEGRVQGVWFRAWTVQEAQARDLVGWVRNRSDGTVEALFAGPVALVDDMVEACRRGPPSAAVTEVVVEPAADIPLTGFHQLTTL